MDYNSIFEKRIADAKEYGNYYIDCIFLKARSQLRIIDPKITFPQCYEWAGHRKDIDIEKDGWQKTNGWGKPDVEKHGIEIRYLWKDLNTPLSFEQWLLTKK